MVEFQNCVLPKEVYKDSESAVREKIDLLQLYNSAVHPQPVSGSGRTADNLAKRDRIMRPTINTEITEGFRAEFFNRWKYCKAECEIKDDKFCIELLECCVGS